MKTSAALLTACFILFASLPSFAGWQGVVASNNAASGAAAAYDAAILALAADLGARLAAESETYPLFRERNYHFGEKAGALIAGIWLAEHDDRIVRSSCVDGEEYRCTITSIAGGFPDLTAVRRDLLSDEVLADSKIHPFVLLELAADDNDLEMVIAAFAERLSRSSQPMLSDLFTSFEITSYSPLAAFELHRNPAILNDLPPEQLLQQLQGVPDGQSVMNALIAAAKAEGRYHTARWLTGVGRQNLKGKVPAFFGTKWPQVGKRSLAAGKFSTPALKWFYSSRRIFPRGSVRQPDDDHFLAARQSESDKLYLEAYRQYLSSIEQVLSYDACLGASECAWQIDGGKSMSAESCFFLLQAAAIAWTQKDTSDGVARWEGVRDLIDERERMLSVKKGTPHDRKTSVR